MKKFYNLALALLFSSGLFAQAFVNPNSELAPGMSGSNSNIYTKALWTVQLDTDPTALGSGLAGVIWFGTEFWCAEWSSNNIYTADVNGSSSGTFTISGVTGTRSMTTDGTHIYIGTAGTSIYKVDPVAKTLTSTISTSVPNCRYLTYDPTLDGGNGGFWTGQYGSDITAVSMTGTTLSTISSSTHGLGGIYGMAYDPYSTGGPYLWAFNQPGNPGADIVQLTMSGVPTGIMHDANSDLNGGNASGLAGGLFVCDDYVNGKKSMIGINQGESLFSYELSDPFALDVAGVAVTTSPYLQLSNAPFTISGEVRNEGLTTITAMDVNYSIDGGATVTQSLSGLNIPLNSSYTFNHSTTWTPSASGIYQVEIWASNINGQTDMNTSNDIASASLMVYNNAVQRIPLYETFTSSTCGPCVAGNVNLESIFAGNPNKYTSIKYQMDWPGSGDPYYTAEGGTRKSYYSVNSVPRLEIDGGWDQNASSVTQQVFDDHYIIPSFTDLTVTYSVAGQTVNVDAVIDPVENISSNNLVLHIAIFEYETENNTGSNGETEFSHVMKKMLPNANGNSITSIQANIQQTINQNYTFNGSYVLPPNGQSPVNHSAEHTVEEFTDLGVAVWIQDNSTKEVLQSATGTLITGINNLNEQLLSAKIYPNPTSNNAAIAYYLKNKGDVNIKVFNNLGEEVINTYQKNQTNGRSVVNINTSILSSGLYTVSLFSNGENIVKKMQIIK